MSVEHEDEDKEDLAENDSPLDLKDWILFLNSESYRPVEIGFLFLTIAIALYASTSIRAFSPVVQLIVVVMYYILIVFVLVFLYHTLEKKKRMDKIIEDIIYGKLTDVNIIREQWKEFNKPSFSGKR